MRIRSIKPEFWRSEDIAALSWDDRLVFIGLWSYVDDNGVGRDDARIIAADLFALEVHQIATPSRDPRDTLATVHRALASLAASNLITRYRCHGKPYLHITTWEKHQRIDRPAAARFPRPDDPDSALTCTDAELDAAFATPSRHPRDTLATGAGEQRNRGTGEEGQPLAQAALERQTSRRINSSINASIKSDFDEWWSVFPRRVGKQAAMASYEKARRTVTADVLLAGARRFADDPTRDPAFTPHPATWLNQGRWDDEGPARPASQQLNSAEQREQKNLSLVAHFARSEHHQPQIGA